MAEIELEKLGVTQLLQLIIRGFRALDGVAPGGFVTDTYSVVKELRLTTRELDSRRMGWSEYAAVAKTVRGCIKEFRNFDSGACVAAVTLAVRLERSLLDEIRHVVREALAVSPDPTHAIPNLVNVQKILAEVIPHLRPLDPSGAANLEKLVAKYDQAIVQAGINQRTAKQAATRPVVRPQPTSGQKPPTHSRP